MSSFPAVCQRCGRTSWSTPLFSASGGASIRVEGLTLGPGNTMACGHCGGTARLVEGTFNLRDGLVEVLSAPDWSMQALRQLLQAAQQAEEIADQDPEAAIGLVARASARAAALLRRVNEIEQSEEVAGLKVILKYLGYCVGGVLAYKGTVSANISVDEIARIVEEALAQLAS